MASRFKVKRPWEGWKGTNGSYGSKVFQQDLKKVKVIESSGPISQFIVPWQTSGMTYYIHEHAGIIHLPLFHSKEPIYADGNILHRSTKVPPASLKRYNWHGWTVKFINNSDKTTSGFDTTIKTGRSPIKLDSPYEHIRIVGNIFAGDGTATQSRSSDEYDSIRIDIGGTGIEIGDELNFTWLDLPTKLGKGEQPSNYHPGRWVVQGFVADKDRYIFEETNP